MPRDTGERVEIRPARDWEEVYTGAVGAGRTFSGRRPEDPFFRNYSVRAPLLQRDNVLFLLVGGKIVSQFVVYDRQVVINGRRTRLGAVTSVYTLPEYQGNGYASRLTEYAAEYIADKGYPLSLLHTGSGKQRVYDANGWVEFDRTNAVFEAPAPAATESDTRFLAYDDGEAGIDRLDHLFEEEYRGIDGMSYRSETYWREWVLDTDRIIDDRDQVRLYPGDGSTQGYLVWAENDGTASCLELAYAGDDRQSFLRDCWNFLASRGTAEIVWHPPLEDALLGAVGREPRQDPIEGTMLQLHDPDLVATLAEAEIATTDDLLAYLLPDLFVSPLDKF